MIDRLFSELTSQVDEMSRIRRYLHQHPELSFHEHKTAAFIADYQHKLGNKVETGVGGGGVVAVLEGKKPGPRVALRADFDALPIQEENEIPYKSLVPGVMHACGHDGHTASLLALAKALNSMQSEIRGNIVFIHQHAEEIVPGGAQAMIRAGCLDGVDAIYASHLWAVEPVGTVLTRSGNLMASSDKFELTILGRGGHAGYPHKTNDAIVIAASLVQQLQQIVSRRVDPLEPAVISIGSFIADNSFNVIADKVRIGGTVRTFGREVRLLIRSEMERMIEGVCRAGDVGYDLNYETGYPAVVNSPESVTRIRSIAAKVPGVHTVSEISSLMLSEDFSFYLEKTSGGYFFVGAGDPAAGNFYPHHHPKFNIDERAMLLAASVLGGLALDALENLPVTS